MSRRCVVMLVAVVAACAGCGGDEAAEVAVRPGQLPRIELLSTATALTDRTPAPRIAGPTDPRGVTPTRLVGGGPVIRHESDHGVIATVDGGRRWRRSSETRAPDLQATGISAEFTEPARGCTALRTTVAGGAPQTRRLPTCGSDPIVAFGDARRAIAVDGGDRCDPEEGETPPRAFVSDDGARTWHRGGALPIAFGGPYDVAAEGELFVVAGTCVLPGQGRGSGPTIAISHDAGERWELARLPELSSSGCSVDVASRGIWIICSQSMYRSADAGRRWRKYRFRVRPEGTNTTPGTIVATSATEAIGIPYEGGAVMRTTDGGAHWTRTWPRYGPCLPGRVPARPDGVDVEPATPACLGLPRRVAPYDYHAVAWRIDARTVLVAGAQYKVGSYRILRRDGRRWRTMFRGPDGSDGPVDASFADVTGDGRTDVLVNGNSGSGGCGARDLIAIGEDRATPLTTGYDCEVSYSLQDGALRERKTIGDCPDLPAGAVHCYGGVRTTVVRYSGTRVVGRRSFNRCRAPELVASKGCRRPRVSGRSLLDVGVRPAFSGRPLGGATHGLAHGVGSIVVAGDAAGPRGEQTVVAFVEPFGALKSKRVLPGVDFVNGVDTGRDYGSVVTGYAERDRGVRLVGFTADGAPDARFGTKGIAPTGLKATCPGCVASLSDGFDRPTVATANPGGRATVRRFTPFGRPDPGFAGGLAVMLPGRATDVELAPGPEDSTYVLRVDDESRGRLHRLDKAGRLDRRFGGDGTVELPGDVSLSEIVDDASGGIHVAVQVDGRRGIETRLLHLDQTGRRIGTVHLGTMLVSRLLQVGNGYVIVVGARDRGRTRIMRMHPDGRITSDRTISLPLGGAAYGSDDGSEAADPDLDHLEPVAVDGDGAIILGGATNLVRYPDALGTLGGGTGVVASRFALARLDTRDRPYKSFGQAATPPKITLIRVSRAAARIALNGPGSCVVRLRSAGRTLAEAGDVLLDTRPRRVVLRNAPRKRRPGEALVATCRSLLGAVSKRAASR